MPRYLRWIAAITTGVTAQFVFVILFGALVIGPTEGNEIKSLSVGAGLLALFGGSLAAFLPTLAVNDWLSKRYPVVREDPAMGAGLHPAQPAREP